MVCPGYDTKQSDGEVSVMMELWGMRSTLSLPLLAGPLGPGMVAPDSVSESKRHVIVYKKLLSSHFVWFNFMAYQPL